MGLADRGFTTKGALPAAVALGQMPHSPTHSPLVTSLLSTCSLTHTFIHHQSYKCCLRTGWSLASGASRSSLSPRTLVERFLCSAVTG